jgi:AcrR family transcriptional regulator
MLDRTASVRQRVEHMTAPSTFTGDPAQLAEPVRTDGRRERSKSSRAKIVAAMLELVERGDVSPSAARVADHAGVGLRTVFRHFDDMDSLYREMSEVIEKRVAPIILRPFASDRWQDRIRELAVRRPEVFEAILPFRISANLKRYQSAFLMADYIRLHKMERALVDVHLPDSTRQDHDGVESLHVALSFQCWRLLRHDQQLTPETAQRVVQRMVTDVLGRLPGGID